MKGFIHGRGIDWRSKGKKLFKDGGGAGVEAGVSYTDWHDDNRYSYHREHQLRIRTNFDNKHGHFYEIVFEYQFNGKKKTEIIKRFVVSHMDRECPKCESNRIDYDKEDEMFHCRNCGKFSYSKESVNALAKDDKYCKHLIAKFCNNESMDTDYYLKDL